jgi:hypothetical protein
MWEGKSRPKPEASDSPGRYGVEAPTAVELNMEETKWTMFKGLVKIRSGY